jgi:hypothetical protein
MVSEDAKMMSGEQSILTRGRIIRVARLESDGFDPLNDPETLLAELTASKAGIDVFTFIQTLPQTAPLFPFTMEWDNLAVLPVSSFDDWWNKQIDRKTRNMARKGEKKGLTVREVSFDDELVQGISGIYNECPVRQGKRFWHYGKTLETVRRENATFLAQSILIGAFVDGSLVGFIKLVVDRDRQQARVMQILSKVIDRDKAPTNAMIAEAVRSCAARGIPNLVYSSFSYGRKQRDSLADFKSSNGFHRVEIPRYYIPLTVRGRVAMQLGFHHRLSERIPESLLATFRRARGAWYAQRFRQEAGSV